MQYKLANEVNEDGIKAFDQVLDFALRGGGLNALATVNATINALRLMPIIEEVKPIVMPEQAAET